MADEFDSALDLLRRLPPHLTSTTLTSLTTLAPHLTEDLLSSVDQPLSVRRCKKTGRDYLLCDYNRDEQSYRSPWSNEWEPVLEGAVKPGKRVREMEIKLNEGVDVYRELYYEGGVSSVYLWDQGENDFAGIVLLKKSNSSSSSWDSIHVFEAETPNANKPTHYKLTSTIILSLSTSSNSLGSVSLAGNLTRQFETDVMAKDDTAHVVNVGRMVEEMEGKMRNMLQEVYFGKTRDVVGDLRSLQSLSETQRDRAAQKEVLSSMAR